MLSISDRGLTNDKLTRMMTVKASRQIMHLTKRKGGRISANRIVKQWESMREERLWMGELQDLTPVQMLRYHLDDTAYLWRSRYFIGESGGLYDIDSHEFMFSLVGLEMVLPDTDVIGLYFEDGTKINLYPEGWGM